MRNMQITKCDKCGKEQKGDKAWSDFTFRRDKGHAEIEITYDLCERCADLLEKFIEE